MARLPWTRLRRQSNSDGLSFGLGAEGLSLEASLLCVRACSERMHDPVPQTGQWLQSIVQGYFNYYAVPGNLTSLGVFRDRVLALWWRTIRRRSQKTGSTGRASFLLAQRWLPQPRALHPFS